MQRRAHLDGDLVSLLDEVLLVGGLVALETLLELLDLVGDAGVVGSASLDGLLLERSVGLGALVVQRRQGVRCVGHGGIDWGRDPSESVRRREGYILWAARRLGP